MDFSSLSTSADRLWQQAHQQASVLLTGAGGERGEGKGKEKEKSLLNNNTTEWKWPMDHRFDANALEEDRCKCTVCENFCDDCVRVLKERGGNKKKVGEGEEEKEKNDLLLNQLTQCLYTHLITLPLLNHSSSSSSSHDISLWSLHQQRVQTALEKKAEENSASSSSSSSSSSLPTAVYTPTSLSRSLPYLSFFFSILLYLNSIWAGYEYDDAATVQSNRQLSSSFPLFDIFKSDYWGTPMTSISSHKSYRPLTILSFRANYFLNNEWMKNGNAAESYHITNILIYALVCVYQTDSELAACYDITHHSHSFFNSKAGKVEGLGDKISEIYSSPDSPSLNKRAAILTILKLSALSPRGIKIGSLDSICVNENVPPDQVKIEKDKSLSTLLSTPSSLISLGSLSSPSLSSSSSSSRFSSSTSSSSSESASSLVSPLNSHQEEVPFIYHCKECDDSISARHQPKFAIASGWYIGVLPERFARLPEIVWRLVSLVSCYPIAKVTSKGANRQLVSHVIVWGDPPKETPPVITLPRLLNEEEQFFRVILAGPFTPHEKLIQRKRYGVCRKDVVDLFNWLKENNQFYKDFILDEQRVNLIPEERSDYPIDEDGDNLESLSLHHSPTDNEAKTEEGEGGEKKKENINIADRIQSHLNVHSRPSDILNPSINRRGTNLIQMNEEKEEELEEIMQHASILTPQTLKDIAIVEHLREEVVSSVSFPSSSDSASSPSSSPSSDEASSPAAISSSHPSSSTSSSSNSSSTLVYSRSEQFTPNSDDNEKLLFLKQFPFGYPLSTMYKGRISSDTVWRDLYLRLSSQQFSDPMALLIHFDQYARKKAMATTSFKLTQAAAERITSIDSHSLEIYTQHMLDEYERARNRRAAIPTEPSLLDPKSGEAELWRKVRTGLERYPLSNEERNLYRMLMTGLINHYGNPSLFFTIAPNEQGALSLYAYSNLAGRKAAGDRNEETIPLSSEKKSIDTNLEKIIPDYSFLKLLNLSFAGRLDELLPRQGDIYNIVSANPVAAAHYFDEIVNIFLHDICGWDADHRRPLKEGGVFGHVKAYAALPETAGRGALHLHGLLWIHGLPKTESEYKLLLESQKKNANQSACTQEDINSMVTEALDTQSFSEFSSTFSSSSSFPSSSSSSSESSSAPVSEPLSQSPEIEAFADRFIEYHDSILSSSLPLDPTRATCSKRTNEGKECGQPVSSFTTVPYTRSAMKAGHPGREEQKSAKCICNTLYSAYEILEIELKSAINSLSDTSEHKKYLRYLFELTPDYPIDEQNHPPADFDRDPVSLRNHMAVLHSMPSAPPECKPATSPSSSSAENRMNIENQTNITDESLMHDILLSLIILRSNLHSHLHTHSCFKRSKTVPCNCCRFRFPRHLVKLSRFLKTGDIEIKRLMGNNYINTYIRLVMEILRCNNDARFLFGSHAALEAFYVIKYVTKNQHRIENVDVVQLAKKSFQKVQSQIEKIQLDFNDDGNSPDRLARIFAAKLIRSMMYQMTNSMEISAPLASFYLIKETLFYSSHEFSPLYLYQSNQIICNSNYEVQLEDEEDRENDGASPSALASAARQLKVRVAQHIDYVERPNELENLTLYDFVKFYYKSKARPGKNGLLRSSPADGIYEFRSSHPEAKTHLLRRRTKAPGFHIPYISGQRLPSLVTLLSNASSTADEEHQNSQRQNYGRLALILTKPLRNLNDLCPSNSEGVRDWWGEFRSYASKERLEGLKNQLNNVADQIESSSSNRMTESMWSVLMHMEEYHIAMKDASYREKEIGEEWANKFIVDDESPSPLSFDENVESDEDNPDFELADEIDSTPLNEEGKSGELESSWMDTEGSSEELITLSISKDGEMFKSAFEMGLHSTVADHLFSERKIKHIDQAIIRTSDKKVIKEIKNEINKKRLLPPHQILEELQPRTSSEGKSSADHDEYKGREALPAILQNFDDLHDPANYDPSSSIDKNTNRIIAAIRNQEICYPTIQETAKAFTLNHHQYRAFSTICRHLLCELYGFKTSKEMKNCRYRGKKEYESQLRMIVTGEGGTGKSQIVHALRAFLRSHRASHALVTMAYTGSAAVAIGGTTIHSALGLELGERYGQLNDEKKETKTRRGKFGNVRLNSRVFTANEPDSTRRVAALPDSEENESLINTIFDKRYGASIVIFDEFSMIDCNMFLIANQKLTDGLRRRADEVYFGNLHVVFMGDFLQLPPISGVPLYALSKTEDEFSQLKDLITEDSSPSTRAKLPEVRASLSVCQARDIWKEFNKCVVLTENQRFKTDTQWGKIVHRFRNGFTSKLNTNNDEIKASDSGGVEEVSENECINKINEKLITIDQINQLMEKKSDSVSDRLVIMFPQNVDRHSFNQHTLRSFADKFKTNNPSKNDSIHRIKAQLFPIIPEKLGKTLTAELLSHFQANQHHLYKLSDDDCGYIPPVIDLYIGMPVLITHNFAVNLGIANGTSATVYALQFPINTQFHEVPMFEHKESDSMPTVTQASLLPDIVWVTIDTPGHPPLTNLPPGFPPNAYPIFPLNKDIKKRGKVTAEQIRSRLRRSSNVVETEKKSQGESQPLLTDESITNRRLDQDPVFRHIICNFRIHQFPIVPAFSLTVHKIQGITADKVIVGGWTSQGMSASLAYVMVSRVRTRAGFFTLDKLTDDKVEKLQPKLEALLELRRLYELDEANKDLAPLKEELDVNIAALKIN